MIKKSIVGIIFLLGLLYILSPQPSSINDFPYLPNSVKSTDPFDYQYPNEIAFFSNYWRADVTGFYRNNFKDLNRFLGLSFPPIVLNHPPEEAKEFIQNEPHSTYLEQYIYPLKDSIYVSGFEPYDQNGKPFTPGIRPVILNNTTFFNSQINVHFFPTSVYSRILIYLGIWVSLFLLYKLFLDVLREKNV